MPTIASIFEQPTPHFHIVDIELFGLEGAKDRQRIGIYLDTDRQRQGRRDGRKRFVHPQRIRPELLVTKRVETYVSLPSDGSAFAAET